MEVRAGIAASENLYGLPVGDVAGEFSDAEEPWMGSSPEVLGG